MCPCAHGLAREIVTRLILEQTHTVLDRHMFAHKPPSMHLADAAEVRSLTLESDEVRLPATNLLAELLHSHFTPK